MTHSFWAEQGDCGRIEGRLIKMATRVLVTSRVWLKVTDLRWASGVVEKVGDKDLVIRLDEDKSQVTVERGSTRISQRTPSLMVEVDDLTALPDLDEPNMLHSLQMRYLRDKIYTRTGPILVGINPWQDLNLYGQENLRSYRGRRMDDMPPHVFGVAEAAFTNLHNDRKDQTILVSGDSGSGKTESTKFMMQYLAAVAHHTSGTAKIEQQVLQCNPVLEAFGNAKTLRNDNSSRFGKYIDIHFDSAYSLSGANIDTYLLEKARVVHQQQGERNFHIFYQLCSQVGTNSKLAQALALRPATEFAYIRDGAALNVGYKTATSFESTTTAFGAIGIPEDEQLQIFQVIAAILHMGNIEVGITQEGHGYISPTDPNVVHCARMLGCEVGPMLEALLMRNIQAGVQGSGDYYQVEMTQDQAEDARNALARTLYESMFVKLVDRINASFGRVRPGSAFSSKPGSGAATPGAVRMQTISILDIFGFEHFKTNHFEQLCINYANEKLQGHFNEFNFSLEVKEYEREHIPWTYKDFDFLTNTECIELVEGKRTGIFALLDEQCIMPNGSDDTFCTKIQQHCTNNRHFQQIKMRSTQFAIRHYAATVTYDATGFCSKNKDPVQPALVSVMSNAAAPFVKELFEAQSSTIAIDEALSTAPGQSSGSGTATPVRSRFGSRERPGGGSTIIFESVTAQFKRQLIDLMGRINAAQPHFVRCINPNSKKQPHLLEPEMILDQLRCSGLMEAVRVSRAGFPIRILLPDFVARFSILAQPIQGMSDQTVVNDMIQKLGGRTDEYRVGLTKVFLKRALHEKLEEDRSKLLVREASLIQKVFRGHRARAYVRELRVLRQQAATELQAASRRTLTRRWYAVSLKEQRQRQEEALRAQKVANSIAQAATGSPQGPAAVASSIRAPSQQQASVHTAGGAGRMPNGMAQQFGSGMGNGSSAPQAGSATRAVVVDDVEVQRVVAERENFTCNVLWQIRSQQDLQDLNLIADKINDRMKAQREEMEREDVSGGGQKEAKKFHQESQARHMDSLRACKALVEEKIATMRRHPGSVSVPLGLVSGHNFDQQLQALRNEIGHRNDDIQQLTRWLVETRSQTQSPASFRGEVDRLHSQELGAHKRRLDEVTRQLEDTRSQLEWKHKEVQDLNDRLTQMRHIVTSLSTGDGAPQAAPMDARVIEQINRMLSSDALTQARDKRISELGRKLEEASRRHQLTELQLAAELRAKDEMHVMAMREKDLKIEELAVKLGMLQDSGAIQAVNRHSSTPLPQVRMASGFSSSFSGSPATTTTYMAHTPQSGQVVSASPARTIQVHPGSPYTPLYQFQ